MPLKQETTSVLLFSLSAKEICTNYRKISNNRIFDRPAKLSSDLQYFEGVTYVSGAFSPNFGVENYLHSIIMKIIVNYTENFPEGDDAEQNKYLTNNYIMPLVISSLKSCVSRLGRNLPPGSLLLHTSLLDYLMLCIVPIIRAKPLGALYIGIFEFFSKELKTLCTFTKYSDSDTARTAPSLAFTAVFGLAFLDIFAHGTSLSDTYDKYIYEFYHYGMQPTLEGVLLRVSEDVVPQFVTVLHRIILNVKSYNTPLNSLRSKAHHCGVEWSPMVMDIGAAEACTVSSFVSLLLGIFNRFSTSIAEICADKLADCRLCCCFDIDFVLKRIFPNIVLCPERVVSTMEFVKNVVMEDLNGYRHLCTNDCNECDIVRLYIGSNEGGSLTININNSGWSRSTTYPSNGKLIGIIQSSPNRILDYISLKWTGFSVFLPHNVHDMKPAFFEQLLYLVRFGTVQVQLSLYMKVYKDWLEHILDERFCTKSNMNGEMVLSLSSIFMATSIIILTNPVICLLLSQSNWQAWKDIFIGESKTQNLVLARTCYTFGYAVAISGFDKKEIGRENLFVLSIENIPPYPAKPRYDALEAVESVFMEAMKLFNDFLQSEVSDVLLINRR